MRSDVDIARDVDGLPIETIAGKLGLGAESLHPYGRDVAKVDLSVLDRTPTRPGAGPGKLILVSAITPTRAGEGKTTTSIGLSDGLARLGESVCLALREPSLGPCMGVKGGATGGGFSQVIPMERINLHFTGDFHAITAAHNLLAAVVDNHLHQGNALNIDPRRIVWRRVMDVSDRALRHIVVGLGGPNNAIPRETGFDITAASEIMAMFCLANSFEDLRARLNRTLVAYTRDKQPVLAHELGVSGAMLALLFEALRPNLVQTLEGTPTFVHGGPFANIAHGCNSVLATRMALHTADWTVTEAGFGFDLGAEKFFDIKCVSAGLNPAAVVLVATVRALKMHGGAKHKALATPDAATLRLGLGNLDKHVENIRAFGEVPIVALNRFASDTAEEIEVVRARCAKLGVPFALCEHHRLGGAGAETLAQAVLAHAKTEDHAFRPLYRWDDPVVSKIEAIARTMYGADRVALTPSAKRDLKTIQRLGYADLPICMAKTPASLSDNPRLRGRPTGFEVTVRQILVNAGAGFLVVFTGDIMRMPGLPKRPLAEQLDVIDNQIVGLE